MSTISLQSSGALSRLSRL